MLHRRTLPVLLLLSAACTSGTAPRVPDDYAEVDAVTILDAPSPAAGRYSPRSREQVLAGKYLVELLGCGACHTDGALVGEPDAGRSLAGSSIGIAWSNPLGDDRPGVVFPPNITPDEETGIGSWSDRQIADAIRAGLGRHGDRRITVMPWPGYAKITEEDVAAIVAYLRSIDPVTHRVPATVPPGQKTRRPFVYFGVYRSR